jgi:hypothetical protein
LFFESRASAVAQLSTLGHFTMNITRITFFILLVMVVWTVGCVSTPDPLAGWAVADYTGHPDEAIVTDYQNYISNLPTKERQFVQGGITFFKDGTGRHAIQIVIPYYGDWRVHVLIYDKDNKRVKVNQYVSGHYRS